MPRAWHLKSRPQGMPTADNFELKQIDLPPLGDAASAKDGDIVFVSAAAGAVGSAVVQIAKAKGMSVIGSAGRSEKCDYVRSLGADQAVDYRAGPLLKSLRAAAPEGIDVYFD